MNRYGNNPEGMSALHYAIKEGDLHAVEMMIANGADVDSVEMIYPNYACSTIVRAAQYNRIEIAEFLLSCGANINFVPIGDCYYHYPLYFAAQSGSGELITLFVKHGAFLDKIMPPDNDINHLIETPLHIAAQYGNYEAVVALIAGGAKINATATKTNVIGSWRDGNPLDYAAYNLTYKNDPQNLELVKFLVENKATRKSQSPIPCPIISGYLQSVGR